MVAEVKLEGFDELATKLRAITPALRKGALRAALAAGARQVRDVAKRAAPVLRQTSKTRKPGTVRDAIRVRTSKNARRQGNVGVFVNVRPAKSGQRGAKNPNDPFYWRFLEFGTKHMRIRSFLKPAANVLPTTMPTISKGLAKWFERAERTGKVLP